MTFWLSWQLWEKMVFVLACLVAIVFIYALIIRFHNKRKTQRLAREEELARAEKGKLPGLNMRTSEEIPFGIRAIELGRHVEGVWISRNNTPLQTPGNSRPTSIHQDSRAFPFGLQGRGATNEYSDSVPTISKQPRSIGKASGKTIERTSPSSAGMTEDTTVYVHSTSDGRRQPIWLQKEDHRSDDDDENQGKEDRPYRGRGVAPPGQTLHQLQHQLQQSREGSPEPRCAPKSNAGHPPKPYARRSLSTSVIERNELIRPKLPLQSLHALDARRQRQAETGQLFPRSAGKNSLDLPRQIIPRSESDQFGRRQGFHCNPRYESISRSSHGITPQFGLAPGPSDLRFPSYTRQLDDHDDDISDLNSVTCRIDGGSEGASNPPVKYWETTEPMEDSRTSMESR